MRLLYLADIRLPTEKAHGGAIMRACASFAEAGLEVELVIPTRKNFISEDPFAYYDLPQSFKITTLPVAERGSYSFRTFLFARAARAYARQAQPDLIYGRDALPLLFASRFAPAFFEAHFARGGFLYSLLLKRVAGLITISDALAKRYEAQGFPADAILTAPSGVDLAIFGTTLSKEDARKELGLDAAPLAIYTGNFTTLGADKGITDILAALKEVPELQFTAVGGNDEDRARYEREAVSLGVADRSRFLGRASQATLAKYQRAADILLMPFPDIPHYREAMSPLKMFEYMASERPIVTTDLPTIREVLGESNALIVPPDDAKALSEALRALMSDPARGTRLAAQARKDVERYSWSERAMRVIAFMRERADARGDRARRGRRG